MTSNATLRHSWHRRISETAVRAAVRAVVAVAPLARRVAGGRPAPTTSTPPAASPFAVSVIDDPDGGVRLVGVYGLLEPRTVGELEAVLATTATGITLHVDLGSADIWPTDVLGRVELALDLAERRGIRLRVVGIDPSRLAVAPPRPI